MSCRTLSGFCSKLTRKTRNVTAGIEPPTATRSAAAADLAKLVDTETAHASHDRLVAETMEKRNDLEAYVYDIRAELTGELAPFGSDGGAVEVDETFLGLDPSYPPSATGQVSLHHMNKVLTLVERNTGRARSIVIDDLRINTIAKVLGENLSREARLITDEAASYRAVGESYASHDFVTHSIGQYVQKQDRTIHTNTVEGFYSIFKRGMKGVYQHCGKQHLHRYAAEFDFRYNNRIALGIDDLARADRALLGAKGKRLTYAGLTA
jgi:hypothetical protein